MSNVFPDLITRFDAMDYNIHQDPLDVAKLWLQGKAGMKCFSNGTFEILTSSKDSEKVRDQATNEVLTTLTVPSKNDLSSVFESSTNGQKKWQNLDKHTRGKLLLNVANIVDQRKVLLSEIEALTFGSVLSKRTLEVSQASLYFTYYAGWAHLLKQSCQERKTGFVVICIGEPSPLMGLIAITAPALAAGNAVLINPTFDASPTAFLLAELCMEAGLPAGVVNVIPGPLNEVQNLIKENALQVSVWGSKPSIKHICNQFADLCCPVMPFSFGKSCSIIFKLSDISSAINILLRNMSFSYRKHPWAVGTIFVEESVFNTFAEAIKKKLVSLTVGGLHEVGVDIQLPQKCDKECSTFLNNALRDFSLRGVEIYQIDINDNLFYPPTVLVGCDAEVNVISKDYNSLPFVSLVPFRTNKEVLGMANKSHFGGAVSVFTDCLPEAVGIANSLEAGTVWINNHGLLDPSVPFSNWKEGGIGVCSGQEGIYQWISSCPKQNTEPGCTAYTCKQGAEKISLHLIESALNAAKKAQVQWAKLEASERTACLLNAANLFHERIGDFESHMKSSNYEINKELESSVNHFYHWAAQCDKLPSLRPNNLANGVVNVLHYPRGVIALVIEDTSHLESFVLNVIRAISFGNSVVVIPNKKSPELIEMFCNLLNAAKIPSGLVSVLQKFKQDVYRELVISHSVDSVWYAGNQEETLSSLYQLTNKTMKYLWCTSDDKENVEFSATRVKAVWFPIEK